MIKNDLAPAEEETKQIPLIEGEGKGGVKELPRKGEPVEDFTRRFSNAI